MVDQKYDDDEQIVATADLDNSGVIGSGSDVGKVQLKFKNEPTLPLEDSNYVLLAEVTARGPTKSRLGADIVMALDLSGSMGGPKLKEMKQALQFVIRKLSPSDRLSVVTFATDSERKCRLRQVTPTAQQEIDFMVQNLVAEGNTNIRDGLQTALKVLDDRKFTSGRSPAIMLMSDGMQNVNEATEIDAKRFPVFTFGFGNGGEYDSRVLNGIASKSDKGTFNLAQPGKLNDAFSQCLGGLLSVLVQDVQLSLAPQTDRLGKENLTTKIVKVVVGNYEQSTDVDGTITVTFSNLYQNEKRSVLIYLIIPKVSRKGAHNALKLIRKYRGESGAIETISPRVFRLKRSLGPTSKPNDATQAEIARVETLELMKEARALADQKNFEEALNKAVKARNSLEDVKLQSPNALIETLKQELDEMVKFLQTEETYKNKGRSFTYASETSHDCQRFACRGDSDKIRPFATPIMDTYLEQAKAFEKDPSKPIPTAADDAKQELLADPLAAIAPSLSFYLEAAIDALKNIQNILNQSP